MHRIKKYANRKLYNVTTKNYVTMDDIDSFVKSGENITIINNSTGKDITQEVLSQLVGRAFDGQARKLPLPVLKQLLQKGSGGMIDYTKRYISFLQNTLNFAEDELDKVNSLIGREKPSVSKKERPGANQNLLDREEAIELLMANIYKQLETKMETQISDTNKGVAELKTEISILTARLEALENIFSTVFHQSDPAVSNTVK